MSIKNQYLHKAFLKLYCYLKLPMIAYCSPKILQSDCTIVRVRIPLKRRTKNHLDSMYFGALSVGADFTAGLLVVNFFKKYNSKAKLIFKDFHADFIKRADSDVVFICNDCNIIKNNVLKNIETGKRLNFTVNVEGFCNHKIIGKFSFTTSIK